MKQKFLLSFMLMLLPIMANAAKYGWVYGTNVNGIYYLFDSSQKTATVTCKQVLYTNNNIEKSSSDYSGAIEIPSEVSYNEETYEVTGIGEVAFSGCTGLTSVSISEGVTSIGERAFYGCTGLTSVSISESVTSIGKNAFENCI